MKVRHNKMDWLMPGAIICFLFNLVLHLAAIVGLNVSRGLIAIGAIPLFFIGGFTIIRASSHYRKKPGPDPWRALLSPNPRWMRIGARLIEVYCIACVILCFCVLLKGGTPTIHNGKTVLMIRNEIIKELTEAEYHRAESNFAIGASSISMVLSLTNITLLSGLSKQT